MYNSREIISHCATAAQCHTRQIDTSTYGFNSFRVESRASSLSLSIFLPGSQSNHDHMMRQGLYPRENASFSIFCR